MPKLDADPPMIELRIKGWSVWSRDTEGHLRTTANRYFFTEDAWAEAQALTAVNGRSFLAAIQYDWSALVTREALFRTRNARRQPIDPFDIDDSASE